MSWSSDFDDDDDDGDTSSVDSTLMSSDDDDEDMEESLEEDEDDEDEEDGTLSDLAGGFSSDASDFHDTPMRTRPPPRTRRPPRPQPPAGLRPSSSESSDPGSPIVARRAKRAQARKKAIVSSSENEADEAEPRPGPSSGLAGTGAQPEADGSSSSDDTGQTECCSICLLKLKGQEIGVPDACEHRYCAECLIEWSENVSTCPIDRRNMRRIQIWQAGQKVRVHKVQKRSTVELTPQDVAGNYFDDTCFCEFCGSGENAHTLLLCDGCDLGYHMVCLEPPLARIPQGRWFCPTCQKAGIGRAPVSRTRLPTPPRFDEFRDTDDSFVVEDGDLDESWRRELDSSFVVPRTVETERIQKRVQQIRRKKAQTKRKTTKRTPKKRRKRKTTTTTASASSSKKKRSSTTTRRKKTSSSRKTKGKGKGKGKSSQRRKPDATEDRAEGTTAPLSLFGRKNDLDFCGDESIYFPENPQPSTSSGVRPRHPDMTHSRAAKILEMSQKAPPKTPEASSSSTMDLLGSIMASQAATLNTHGSQTVSTKLKEVYTKPEGIEQAPLEKCKSPPISRPPYRKTSSSSAVTIASPKETLSKLARIKEHTSQSIKSLSTSIKDKKNSHETNTGESKDLTRIVSKRSSAYHSESKDFSQMESKKIKLEQDAVTFDPTKRSYEPSVSRPSTSSLSSSSVSSSSSSAENSSRSAPFSSSSSLERKTQKLTEISLVVKKYLKPFHERGTISKADYKFVLKKSVEKIFSSHSNRLQPEKVESLVNAYVKGINISY
ncbi:hypothetical protein TCAL_06007 [Tigriopus californicus]|uniref:PHD and RING finger domain-containing protein 1 n=1 Tax=Tigriopus californicus TaxID=6832 RepID=A0A553PQJ9_TIGCA|nr:PHD and RING finger domain-containing protein 1-like [Tigriopus californicus]TRY79945.1 hypothetical protein TCAL_06007 [Tigriopus californicus]|eukprot:TCALIF_06007-PA protein Name:"Similar to PHRF1 PHD and RING finger domain-containing protein 1 (Homo sapiens)" AED:0.47 eAED:0.47 QI:0/-1/0/1/-1/1/1/0/773